MAVTVVLGLFVLGFAGAATLGAKLPERMRSLPFVVLAGIAFLMFFELARYDQGYAELLYYIGFIAAPVIAIFGGAAWGARRLYGWPDFGPHPSHAALIAAAMLGGVLLGVDQKPLDIRATRDAVAAWASAGAQGTPPRSSLGWIRPPAVERRVDAKGEAVVAFPIGNDRWHTYHLARKEWLKSTNEPRQAGS